MSLSILASTDGVLGLQLGTEQKNRFINRTGSTLVLGEAPCLDIQMVATETVNFLENDPGSVWANVIQARNSRDYDDKPFVVVTGVGNLADNGTFQGALWSADIPILCQARTDSGLPTPDPVPVGTPINTPALSGSPFNRNMLAQQANFNADNPAYSTVPAGRRRELGAKYTGRLWETIARDVVANRRCLWNGWTGFGNVSNGNP